MSTVIVAVIVFGFIGLICFRLYRNKKKHQSDCNCGTECDQCPYDTKCK